MSSKERNIMRRVFAFFGFTNRKQKPNFQFPHDLRARNVISIGFAIQQVGVVPLRTHFSSCVIALTVQENSSMNQRES